MPCDTVQTNTVSVPHMIAPLRARGLKALGIHVQNPQQTWFSYDGDNYRFANGNLVSNTADADTLARVAALVKRAYSAEVVQYTAQRNGWTVRKTAAFEYEVIK